MFKTTSVMFETKFVTFETIFVILKWREPLYTNVLYVLKTYKHIKHVKQYYIKQANIEHYVCLFYTY